jgi:hypothetical protein
LKYQQISGTVRPCTGRVTGDSKQAELDGKSMTSSFATLGCSSAQSCRATPQLGSGRGSHEKSNWFCGSGPAFGPTGAP